MKTPTTSLIISVYKNTKDLEAVLNSVKEQEIKPNEIIISEDGDSVEMKAFLNAYSIEIPLIHLTEEDKGWQKNKCLNKAILSSNFDYLIFIDGDCVLHTKFIKNHLKLSNTKEVLAGKRLKLGSKYSELLRNASVREFQKKIIKEGVKIKADKAQFYEEGIYFPLNIVSKFIIKLLGISSIKGCNFSCYKTAIMAINGFDEDYIRPAIGEDIDLYWRFKGLGYDIVSIKHFAIQYHLHHKENWTDQEENVQLMKKNQALNRYFCLNGIQKQTFN